MGIGGKGGRRDAGIIRDVCRDVYVGVTTQILLLVNTGISARMGDHYRTPIPAPARVYIRTRPGLNQACYALATLTLYWCLSNQAAAPTTANRPNYLHAR